MNSYIIVKNSSRLAHSLLLSSEWGCGKTYLIEHDLKDTFKDKFYILRVSLFKITLIEEMYNFMRKMA